MKLGRLPRKFDTRIPHMKAFLKANLPPPPLTVDFTADMPDDLGFMANDRLGDCTCAAYFHAYQLWTFNAKGKMVTESDDAVLKLYEQACGYNPGDASSDQGGVEQDVLAWLLNTGALLDDGRTEKIIGYVEADYRNLDHIKRVIADCGVAYVGIQMPQGVMDHIQDNNIVWGTDGDQTIVGGHAVVLAAYDLDTFTCISWGKRYRINHDFLANNLEEAYGIISSEWVETSGVTPFGMSLSELQAQMQALKE